MVRGAGFEPATVAFGWLTTYQVEADEYIVGLTYFSCRLLAFCISVSHLFSPWFRQILGTHFRLSSVGTCNAISNLSTMP